MTPDESFGQWSTSVDDINKSPEGCISCEFDELPQVGVYVSLDSMTCRDNKLMSCPGLNIGGPLTQSITKGSCICLSNAKDATPPIARVFKINPEYHIGEGHIEFLLESQQGVESAYFRLIIIDEESDHTIKERAQDAIAEVMGDLMQS